MPHSWMLWLDVNISPVIAKWMIDELALNAHSAYTLQLYDKTDFEIYQMAKPSGDVIIISKDVDFSELITRLGAPPKLININIGNCDNRYLWSRIKPQIQDLIRRLSCADIDIVDFQLVLNRLSPWPAFSFWRPTPGPNTFQSSSARDK
ncbi:DUF5615 family PIN-like protein [Niabella insulamsoli]|uniref:DUF5615 family PIN-like protein n=1 Tax=Niabella insulamsoli TaxID=3144874 RepID=UPI003D10479D